MEPWDWPWSMELLDLGPGAEGPRVTRKQAVAARPGVAPLYKFDGKSVEDTTMDGATGEVLVRFCWWLLMATLW
jgi:hypothetical protein